jgi:hypothetical protein
LTNSILEKYDLEHPTLLAYELLSRLLKHRFRSVQRHETVAALLGPDRLSPKWGTEPERWIEERKKYSYRRAILELAFSGAKGRGLLSLGPLALDRPSRYYKAQELREAPPDRAATPRRRARPRPLAILGSWAGWRRFAPEATNSAR